jgi:hypothetical protein
LAERPKREKQVATRERLQPEELIEKIRAQGFWQFAKSDSYVLFENRDPLCGFCLTKWRSFKLVEPKRRSGRRLWSLGWNGERFANNVCLKHLRKNNPAALKWVGKQIGA